ncbi:MAG: hypothetical protein ACQEXJ_10100 [Myxococcota bacterium]
MIATRWTPAALAALIALSSAGCATEVDRPVVQPSSTASPGGRIVQITEEGEFSPTCMSIRTGQTVEWRNFSPDIPTNVTSLGEPVELFSPSLVPPYQSDEVDGEAYVWWRHTFDEPGVYEYFDTNQGDPGRKVVDPYYGTVTFVGIDKDVRTGVICVEEPGSDACAGVCCSKNLDCPTGQCCDLEERKVCLQGSPAAEICRGTPAHREFECFDDSHCVEGEQCLVESTHTCQ